MPAAPAPLRCPGCGRSHPAAERFCADCGLPLVHGPEVAAARGPLSERQQRARKVKGQYSEGPLVRVARARNQAEAELLAGMLLEEGVASVVRRSGGFDVPDFLAAGPRDVLVAQSGADVARDVLLIEPLPEGTGSGRPGAPVWVQALAVTMVAIVLATVAAGVFVAVF
ncbi:MAG TPA: hypothetical protein VF533_06485 [Solirubrobacteraceae bacterium]|jgi:hypothetical protein